MYNLHKVIKSAVLHSCVEAMLLQKTGEGHEGEYGESKTEDVHKEISEFELKVLQYDGRLSAEA